MNRCKKGDLAFVCRDFDGCEGNLGKIVRVVSSCKTDKRLGRLWTILPLAKGWWFVSRAGLSFSAASFSENLENCHHPDAWLIPLRGNTAQNLSSTEVSRRRNKATAGDRSISAINS